MKRRILVVLLLIVAIIAVEAAEADGGLYVLCRTMVNVRSKPSKTARVVAWVECGQYVQTDGQEKRGFVHVVNLPSEEPEGWIYSGYLVDEAPQIRTYRAEIWDGDVIARGSVGGRALRKMREGQTVTVYAKNHIWAVTNRGFIMCDWLREIDP